MEKDYLFGVRVPKETETYAPISHQQMVETIYENLDKSSLKIKSERFEAARSGQQMFGKMIIEGGNGEQDMNLGFRNSYDKSMQLGLVAGSQVIVCSNMMFHGDLKILEMHRGNIAKKLDGIVAKAVASLVKNFDIIQADTEKLKQVEVDEKLIAHVLGELFFQEDLITHTQLKVIKEELVKLENFGNETMWDIYNHTTEALKKSPVNRIITDHVKVHEFYMRRSRPGSAEAAHA